MDIHLQPLHSATIADIDDIIVRDQQLGSRL